MKIDCSSGSIKNVDVKSGPRRPAALVCVSVILLLVLAGCGRLSLLNLLENEQPGTFSAVPKGGVVPADTIVDVSGKGGFEPYSYEKLTGKGTIDPATGEYVAPTAGEISGDSEETEIMVTDALASEAAVTLTVYKPLTMSPASKTIEVGQLLTFTVSGGVPVPDYDFYVNDDLKGSASPSWSYTFPSENMYLVEAVDSLGNRVAATIETIAVGGDLGIDASPHFVVKGGSLTVTAVNAVSPFTFSIEPAGVGSFAVDNVSPTTYNAPLSETTVTIKLSDNLSRTASTTVIVVGTTSQPLTLSPSALDVDEPLEYGDSIVFRASGGIPPYSFWAEHDDLFVDRVVQIPPDRARYTAPNFNTTDWFYIEDAVGATTRVKIKVKDD